MILETYQMASRIPLEESEKKKKKIFITRLVSREKKEKREKRPGTFISRRERIPRDYPTCHLNNKSAQWHPPE